jgi:hypothetical protein
MGQSLVSTCVLFPLLTKATVYAQVLQTPFNSPLVRGRTRPICLEHDEIWYFLPLQATVCAQVFPTPSNSPLPRGRTGFACLEHDEIWYFLPLQGGTKGGRDCKGFRYLCVYRCLTKERARVRFTHFSDRSISSPLSSLRPCSFN